MARALARRQRTELTDMIRHLFDADWDSSWLRVEEFVDGTDLVVRAELPGIDPDSDVDLEVIDGALRITAERKETSEHKEKDSYRSEFRYGSFTRTVPLPAGATEADVRATYTDGVLEVRVPVGDEPEPTSRKVPITRG